MSCVLALDEGTTGSTALVVSQEGDILGRGYREFTQHFPRPGWVEHDPEEIWRVTLEAGRAAIAQAGVTPSAIGITNQRETIAVWDRATGTPLHRALVWQDRRTVDHCRALREELGDEYVSARTGLVWDPYFSATKIAWLLSHVPDLRARASGGDALFGTIDSWLVYRLTGGRSFVTDHSNASRTLLYNVHRMDWDDDLLSLFEVPRQSLPDTVRSSGVVGTSDAAHFGVAVPVSGIAGDQQAALYGQGCWEPGQAKCTYGTGAFLLMPLKPASEPVASGSGLLTTVACDATGGPMLALEGSIFIAGAAVQWLRDGLGLISSAAETEALASGIEGTEGVFFVPAFVGLGAPYWEPDARGTIVGMTRGTTREHIVRAALEAMAYSTRDVVDAMVRDSGVALEELRVDGGAAANDWLMQFQADVLDIRVLRPDIVETTALGAAGLAGLATGLWATPEEFAAGRVYKTFEPAEHSDSGYDGWRRAVSAAVHWARS